MKFLAVEMFTKKLDVVNDDFERSGKGYGRFNKDLEKAETASVRAFSAKTISGKTFDKIEFRKARSCVFQQTSLCGAAQK